MVEFYIVNPTKNERVQIKFLTFRLTHDGDFMLKK